MWGSVRQVSRMDLVVRRGSLVVATPGDLEKSPPPGPSWIALADVRQVL
jgi:hypothetical protein